jgi:hypothetical protein
MALAFALLGSVGCDSSDDGTPCPELLSDDQRAHLVTQNGDGTVNVLEIYGTSAKFPCQDLICVAADGRDGYCTNECQSDSSCPNGFECKSISGGAFARNLCVWKTCAKDADCGDKKKLKCETVDNVVPGEDFKLCAFKD